MPKPTRGERNNNPGNIRLSKIEWKGEVHGFDPAFESFDTPGNGIRALARILLSYSDKYGLNTIQKIICRWAPDSENDTGAYINSVCSECDVLSNIALDLHDENTLYRVTKAIIRHENGRVSYADDVILGAVRRALA